MINYSSPTVYTKNLYRIGISSFSVYYNQIKQRGAFGNSGYTINNYLLFDSNKIFKYYSMFGQNISVFSTSVG